MLQNMNIFFLHYFLWSGGLSPIYSYVSVYAEHYANASSSQYGLLNMVLPFVTVVTNVLVCSAADRYDAHRKFFLAFLFVAVLSYGSYGMLPFLVERRPEEGLNLTAWTLICIITTASTITIGVITCLSDTFAVNSSKRHGTSYGRIRVGGTLGWGVSSLVLSFINQTDRLPLLVPGLIMATLLILVDLIASTFWPDKNDYKLEQQSNYPKAIVTSLKPQKQIDPVDVDVDQVDVSSIKIQWKLLKEVAKKQKSIFAYMFLFMLSGALTSLQWSYFFPYLKNIYGGQFGFVSSFTMMIDSLGELPFLLLSDRIIRVLGRDHTLGISFLLMGARYLLYAYLLPNFSMYSVIIPELLQGPSFGLFYVTMTEVANDYAECDDAIATVIDREGSGAVVDSNNIHKLRQALRATMQSLCYTCYEGIGLGIGSIVGGVCVQYYGFDTLWLYSGLISLAVGLATSLFGQVHSIRSSVCSDKVVSLK